MKKISLYAMALFYTGAGVLHFIVPQFYLQFMPVWMPAHLPLIYLSGMLEILLGIFLIPIMTRRISAQLIILMLGIFFFLIHIPMTIIFYQTNDPHFTLSIIRLPIQFVLAGWAWTFHKKR